jgi:rare lipoprotein A
VAPPEGPMALRHMLPACKLPPVQHRVVLAVLAALTVLAGCSTEPERARPEVHGRVWSPSFGTEIDRGKASWYGPGFQGKRTASGERFDMNALTAAHRTLPFGTRVKVRNVLNGREVVVRITDRGPHIRDRIIDLSKAAAAALDLVQAGEGQVVLLKP